MTTREIATEAVTTLNGKIANLRCGAAINAAKTSHELDNGFSKIESVADAIKPLAMMVHFMRHEARAVSIPDGSYAHAIKLCGEAETIVALIDLIEARSAA